MTTFLFQYLHIFIFILSSFILAFLLLVAVYVISFTSKVDLEKFSAYECRFQPFSETSYPFEVRFAVIAIMFLLFDIKVLYLFPLVEALYCINSIELVIILLLIYKISKKVLNFQLIIYIISYVMNTFLLNYFYILNFIRGSFVYVILLNLLKKAFIFEMKNFLYIPQYKNMYNLLKDIYRVLDMKEDFVSSNKKMYNNLTYQGETLEKNHFTIGNPRSVTNVCLQTNVFSIKKRYMQTASETTPYISNAITNYLNTKDPVFLPEADNLTRYIITNIQERPFSEIIQNSYHKIGCYIHPSSFIACIEGFRDTMKQHRPDFVSANNNEIANADDLGLYHYDGTNLTLKQNYNSIYNNFLNLNEAPISTFKEVDSYHSLSSSNSSVSSDTSSMSNNSSIANDAEMPSNRNFVIVCTIVAFMIIQGLAWYQRTYNKATLNNDKHISEEEDILYSVHESAYFSYYILFLFIPPIMLIIYSLRHYYFYTVISFLKNLKNK